MPTAYRPPSCLIAFAYLQDRHAEALASSARRFKLRHYPDLIAGRKLPSWHLHNLRHSMATHAVEDLGISSDVVSLLLSHRPAGPAVSRIYTRAERLNERREALTRWAQWIDGLLGIV